MPDDIKRAFDSVQQAEEALQQAYKAGFEDGYKDGPSLEYRNYREVARELALLESQVRSFKEMAIKAAVQSGEKTKDIAESYGISSARVSQIAPRRLMAKDD